MRRSLSPLVLFGLAALLLLSAPASFAGQPLRHVGPVTPHSGLDPVAREANALLQPGPPPQFEFSGIIFESAKLGRTGEYGGYALEGPSPPPHFNFEQYLGARFYLDTDVRITAIGGHVVGFGNPQMSGQLFGAIVPLSGPAGLPTGSPFDSITLASVVFRGPYPSGDVLVPLVATVPPGYYGLIFGAGQFGAEVPSDFKSLWGGAMPDNNRDIPGQASYFNYGYWSLRWDDNNAEDDNMRFVVYGEPLLRLSIDIRPGDPTNVINPKAKGKIPVALLSSAVFNALTDIDRTSLTFGATGDEPSLAYCDATGTDVNGDGLRDLTCHFHTATAGFGPGDTQGVLKARSVQGVTTKATDAVTIVPK